MSKPNSSISSVTVNTSLPGSPTLAVSASGSLMKNYLPALPIAPGDQISAVCDLNGYPITFSFGAASGDFYAIVNTANNPTGWSQIDLLPGVAGLGTPVYFTSGQLSNGNISLFLACKDEDTGAVSTFVAGPLSNNPQVTDFANLAALWTPAANPLPGATVSRASISPLDDGQGYGIPMIAVGLQAPGSSSVATYMMQCALNLTTGVMTWNWQSFPSPTDAQAVLDYAPGAIADLGQGMYMLYSGQDGGLNLVFKTLLNEYGRDYVRSLTVPAGQNSLQTTAGSAGSSYLYAGGQSGVTFWNATAQQAPNTSGLTAAQTIADGSQLPDMTPGGLVVRQNFHNSNAISVWALSGSNLFMFNQLQYQGSLCWSTPLVLKTGIQVIAPLVNQTNHANELVFLSTNWETEKAINYMWQDPATTLWQEASIPLYNSDKVIEVNSYSTKLAFRLNGQTAAARLSLTLTSASYQSLLINGLKYTVNAGASLQVNADAVGELNLIQQIQDLAVSTFTLTSSAFSETLQINPASNVYKKLAAVQTGADIPVLPATLPPGVTADQIASAISQMMGFQPDPPYPTEVISIAAPPAAQVLAVAPPTAEARHVFALSFGPQGISQFHAGPQAAQMAVFESAGEWIVDAVGDVVQFVGNVVSQIGHMLFEVAETVIKITLNVAGRVIKFVIQNFPQLFALLTALFKVLLVGLDKLIGWLGELFGWDDIWATHTVIATALTGALDALAKAAQGDSAKLKLDMAKAIGLQLGYVRDNFASMAVPASVAQTVPVQSASAQQQANPDVNLNTPIGGWSAYQTQYSGMLLGGGSAGDVPGPVQAFIDDVLVPACTVLAKELGQDLKNLEAIFSGDGATVQDIVTFLQGIVMTVIDTLEVILVGCVEFLLDLVPWVVSLLTEPVNMPFLSGFYTWLTDALGQGDTQSEALTVVNLMSLLVAIPYTYLYKATHEGQPPFPTQVPGQTDRATLLALPARGLHSLLFAADESSDGPSKGAVAYSIFGSGIGSIAALLASLMGFIHTGLEEGDAKGKVGKFLAGGILGMGGIALAGTYPVSSAKLDGWAHGTRVAAWVGSGFRLVSTLLPVKSVAAKGAVKAGFNLGIGLLALTSDILSDASAATWCSDICSDGGGLATGICLAAEQPEFAVVGQGVAYLGGNLVGLITAMNADIDGVEALYFVNMGG